MGFDYDIILTVLGQEKLSTVAKDINKLKTVAKETALISKEILALKKKQALFSSADVTGQRTVTSILGQHQTALVKIGSLENQQLQTATRLLKVAQALDAVDSKKLVTAKLVDEARKRGLTTLKQFKALGLSKDTALENNLITQQQVFLEGVLATKRQITSESDRQLRITGKLAARQAINQAKTKSAKRQKIEDFAVKNKVIDPLQQRDLGISKSRAEELGLAQKISAVEKAIARTKEQVTLLSSKGLNTQKDILATAERERSIDASKVQASNKALNIKEGELEAQLLITKAVKDEVKFKALASFAKANNITDAGKLKDIGLPVSKAEEFDVIKKISREEKIIRSIKQQTADLQNESIQSAKVELSIIRDKKKIENDLRKLKSKGFIESQATLKSVQNITSAKIKQLTIEKQLAAAKKSGAVTTKDFAAFGLNERDLRVIGQVSKETNKLKNTFAKASKAGNRLTFTFRRMVGIMAAFTIARKVVQGFNSMIRSMLNFQAEMEQSVLGIGALFASTGKIVSAQGRQLVGQEALTAAIRLGRKELDLLLIDSIKTNATFLELAQTFQVAVGPGLAGGLSVAKGELREVVIGISRAASAAGIAQNQLSEEIRSLLSGTGTIKNTRLLPILFGADSKTANQQIKDAIKSGKLIDLLREKFKAFSLAGDIAEKNFKVLFTNMVAGFQLVSSAGGIGLFNSLKEAMTKIKDTLVTINSKTKEFGLNPQIVEVFQAVGDSLSNIVQFAIQTAKELGTQGLLSSAKGLGISLELVGKLVIIILSSFLDIAKYSGIVLNQFGQLPGPLGEALLTLVKWAVTITTTSKLTLVLVGLFASVGDKIVKMKNDLLKHNAVQRLVLVSTLKLKSAYTKLLAVTTLLGESVFGATLFGSISAATTAVLGLISTVLILTTTLAIVGVGVIALFKVWFDNVTGMKTSWKGFFEFVVLSSKNAFLTMSETLGEWFSNSVLLFFKMEDVLGSVISQMILSWDLFLTGSIVVFEELLLASKQIFFDIANAFLTGVVKEILDALVSLGFEISKLPFLEIIGAGIAEQASIAKNAIKSIGDESIRQSKLAVTAAENKSEAITASIKAESTAASQSTKEQIKFVKALEKSNSDAQAKRKKAAEDALFAGLGNEGKVSNVPKKTTEASVKSALSSLKDLPGSFGSTTQNSANLQTAQQEAKFARQQLGFAKSKFIKPGARQIAGAENKVSSLQLDAKLGREARDNEVARGEAIIKSNKAVRKRLESEKLAADVFLTQQKNQLKIAATEEERKAIKKEIINGELSLQVSAGAVQSTTEQILEQERKINEAKAISNALDRVDQAQIAQAQQTLNEEKIKFGEDTAAAKLGFKDALQKAADDAPTVYSASLDIMTAATSGFASTVSNLLTDAFSGKKLNAAAAFGQFFSQLGAMIIKTIIQLLIMKALMTLLGPVAAAPGPGAAAGGKIGVFNKLFTAGATPSKGGLIKGYASGGAVDDGFHGRQGVSSVDSVPAWLSPGEFVMTPQTVKAWGVGAMHAINSGAASPFALGGLTSYGNRNAATTNFNSAKGFAAGGPVTPNNQAPIAQAQTAFVMPATNATMEELLSGGESAMESFLKSRKSLIKGLSL